MLEILEKIELAVRRAAEQLNSPHSYALHLLAVELKNMASEERKKREETKG